MEYKVFVCAVISQIDEKNKSLWQLIVLSESEERAMRFVREHTHRGPVQEITATEIPRELIDTAKLKQAIENAEGIEGSKIVNEDGPDKGGAQWMS